VTFESYLARFAAARLLSWWSRGERWSTWSMIAAGELRWRLLGKPALLKPKDAKRADEALDALRSHHVADLAPCCEESEVA
jgi:hypothetical protein